MTAVAPTSNSTTDRLIATFRTIAVAEAISWAGLLIAMLFKYVVADTPTGVEIMGPIHGAIFIAYLIVTLAVGVRCRWTPSVILIGLFAAVPPFTTVVFEKWADREGHLREPGSDPAA